MDLYIQSVFTLAWRCIYVQFYDKFRLILWTVSQQETSFKELWSYVSHLDLVPGTSNESGNKWAYTRLE